MKKSEVKNKHKNKYGKIKTIFINLVFQAQDIPRWRINDTQIQTLCTWRNEKMGIQLLVILYCSGKLDRCKVTISYRKYTWISNRINLLCTCLSPSLYWYGCLREDSFRNRC